MMNKTLRINGAIDEFIAEMPTSVQYYKSIIVKCDDGVDDWPEVLYYFFKWASSKVSGLTEIEIDLNKLDHINTEEYFIDPLVILDLLSKSISINSIEKIEIKGFDSKEHNLVALVLKLKEFPSIKDITLMNTAFTDEDKEGAMRLIKNSSRAINLTIN